jgi:uncharacterized phage protein gp47/JayE
MAGIDSTGFVKKTLAEIKDEIETAERAAINPALNLSAASVFGQINGIFADKLRELWDVAEAIYRSLYPDSAMGDALDNIASISGAVRQAATFSTVVIRCTGTNGTVLPAGRVVSVVGTGDRFASDALATIPVAGFVDVAFTAEETGPVAAPAGTLTVIETPVAGWVSATNLLDAELGTDEETDAAFRDRRLDLLAATGKGTVEAVRANLLSVTNVVQAFVFENVTNVTDVDGLPPKSFEAVVEGGANADIAASIFATKPIGIESFGSTTVPVVDSQGFSHDIDFSRPITLDVWVDVTVVVNAAVFGGGDQAAGIAQVKDAIVALGDSLDIGEDVIALAFKCAPLDVAGVLDVTVFFIEVGDPTPDQTVNIVVAPRELALFDTSRVLVTVV